MLGIAEMKEASVFWLDVNVYIVCKFKSVYIYQKIICYLFDLFNIHANVEEKKMIGWSAKSTCNIDGKESVPPLLNSRN